MVSKRRRAIRQLEFDVIQISALQNQATVAWKVLSEGSKSFFIMSEDKENILDQCSLIFFEHQLMKEFILLQQQGIPHIYIVPSHQSPLKWFGVMFVHDGLYQGAILRFTLMIPNSFPDCTPPNLPKIVFDTPPFHPLVDQSSGVLSLHHIFPEWKPNEDHLWKIISNAKRVFYDLERELDHLISSYSFDDEDDKSFISECLYMYKNEPQLFSAKIAQSISQIVANIYSPPKEVDQNAIIFKETDEETAREWRKRMLSFRLPGDDTNQEDGQQRPAGLSWVQDGIIFSKPIS